MSDVSPREIAQAHMVIDCQRDCGQLTVENWGTLDQVMSSLALEYGCLTESLRIYNEMGPVRV